MPGGGSTAVRKMEQTHEVGGTYVDGVLWVPPSRANGPQDMPDVSRLADQDICLSMMWFLDVSTKRRLHAVVALLEGRKDALCTNLVTWRMPTWVALI